MAKLTESRNKREGIYKGRRPSLGDRMSGYAGPVRHRRAGRSEMIDRLEELEGAIK